MLNQGSILVVDDNKDFCEELKSFFNQYGYETHLAYNAQHAMDICEQQPMDLIVLDLLFPESNGITTCKELRSRYNIPIIIVSGLTDDTETVVSLEVGADCYLSKPINPRFLLAQINACLRRSKKQIPRTKSKTLDAVIYQFAHCELNSDTQKLYRADTKEPVALSKNEFKVLMLLLKRPGFLYSRDSIMEHLELKMDNFDRSIDVLICRLRNKIGKDQANNQSIIRTVRGCGYSIDCDVNIAGE